MAEQGEFIKIDETNRGFVRGTFRDCYDKACSIQESSLGSERAIWLGVDDPEPMVLHWDARKLGIETDATCGWVPYPIPKEVLLSTRMHLTQEQAAQLIPMLQRFVDTGEL